MKHIAGMIGLAIVMTLGESVGQAAPDELGLTAWQVDSMLKIFKDDAPPAKTASPLVIDAARNEVVSGQIVVRCAEPMENLVCRASKLTLGTDREIPAPGVRYVGYVPVGSKTIGFQLRPRPCDYPDPLFDNPASTIPAKTSQPIWLTLKIPADAAPGLYQGSAEIEAKVKGAARNTSVPVAVQVYPAVLTDKRTLKISNWAWFDSPAVAGWCGVKELYSEPFWKLMEEVARDMAAHRQNVIFTPTTAWTWGKDDPNAAQDLITGKVGENGELQFDFTLFDRWVKLFRAAGVDGLIEGHPLTHRSKQDRKENELGFKSVIWKIENGKAVRRIIVSVTPEYEKYLSVYLPALQTHLEQQGWLQNYVQHVLDEPNGQRKPTYDKVAKWFKKYAPRIKILDATQITDLVGSIDIWAPLIPAMAKNIEFYKGRQAKGEEVWFYTCLVPGGPDSLNRFVEYPLTRVRLLHWANYASGTTGYLHWAYNWWVLSKDPLAGKWRLPPGDEWIVYPKKGGVYDSIRFEAMLEGIQDYELLKTLAVRDPAAASAICEKLVKFTPDGPRGYKFDDKIDALRAARRQLLEALSK